MPNKNKSLTISFKPDSFHLYEFLKKQDNRSAYILRLIREDMEKQGETWDLRTEIIKVLDEMQKTDHLSLNFNRKTEESELIKEDIELISNFF